MSKLSENLKALLDFVGKIYPIPKSQGILIFEWEKNIKSDGNGRFSIPRNNLVKSENFEKRFDELMKQGFAWINLSCYGTFDNFLIVGVETPVQSSPRNDRTSVNYSGPPKKVVENEWDIGEIFEIRD